MIITRTPFRVSFSGGGSDIPAFYEKHGGCIVSTTIDKYMHISIHPTFDERDIILKYSVTETIRDYKDVKHKYYRKILSDTMIRGVEITSTADVPAGTGLGSSSSFTVGVFHAINSYQNKLIGKEKLARQACELEIEELGLPIGKQDQYAAAYGGLNYYEFQPDGSVMVHPILMQKQRRRKLEQCLMLFYTGGIHSAETILKEQSKNIISGEREQAQLKMCELTRNLRNELARGNIDSIGEIMNDNWQLKRTLAHGITNPHIDELYELALKNGAKGGKLLGAGGGGFLLLYVPQERQHDIRTKLQMKDLPFNFDVQGSSIIYVEN